ncbi:MAG: class I SAM-dependent methyltransferase [Desulfobacteraceae bacterium]|nr:MAG: class I SAM-dependent methyltransferase [Desulfobacteraceae bacterium]
MIGEKTMAEKACPLWVGYLLACPLRKWVENPATILGPYVKQGMQALDIGSATGFFSLPMAERVGPNGKVICLDIREKFLEALKKRARKKGLFARVETRLCRPDSPGLDHLKNQIDFAFASAVIHEVPDAAGLFKEVHQTLKPGGLFLVIEPKSRVSLKDFETSISRAESRGFLAIDTPSINRGRVILLKKKQTVEYSPEN